MLNKLKREYELGKDKFIKRLKEFRLLSKEEYYYEFLFCLLTPQSNAKKCWQAIEEIRKLDKIDRDSVREILKTKTRFHNNKSSYIIEAKLNWNNILNQINREENVVTLRNWLADNVKGYGLKEASHFIRNVGKSENKIAILDRHILRNLKLLGIIDNDRILNKKNYFDIEQKFLSFSIEIGIPIDHLDLFFWSRENGEIFK